LVLGKCLTDKELIIVFKEYDADNSGEIDLGEFTHMMMVFLKMPCRTGCTLCTYPEHCNQPQTVGGGEGGGVFQARWAGGQLPRTGEEPKSPGTHFTEFWNKFNDNEKAKLLSTAAAALKPPQHQPEGVSDRYQDVQEQRRPGSLRGSVIKEKRPLSQENEVVTQRKLIDLGLRDVQGSSEALHASAELMHQIEISRFRESQSGGSHVAPATTRSPGRLRSQVELSRIEQSWTSSLSGEGFLPHSASIPHPQDSSALVYCTM
jgi:hypothetical protein